MTKKSAAQSATDHGEEIIASLNDILKRCSSDEERLKYPGEGGERPFRGLLMTELLPQVFNWPTDRVRQNERFDLLLKDRLGFPIIYIETKAPEHHSSAKERGDFEARISGFGTLRTAYYGDGHDWMRLDLQAPDGDQVIQSREEFSLAKDTAKSAASFFAPLEASRYVADSPRLSRYKVQREAEGVLGSLAKDLHLSIGALSSYFEGLFEGYRAGKAGEGVESITLHLFDLWCDKSLILSPSRIGKELSFRLTTREYSSRELRSLLGELGIKGTDVDQAADALMMVPNSSRSNPDALAEAIWPAYQTYVSQLCAQTAHVLLARVLLYRVGEDQGVFPQLLSREALESALTPPTGFVLTTAMPATSLITDLQSNMQDFLPALFKLGEFDWWLAVPEKRAVMTASERSWMRSEDGGFETALETVLRVLDGYSFAEVNVDVWQNVYQHYLPAEERQRLGGFYTPDELVDFVLDLSDFKSGSHDLCKLSFIDPACGSGAFVTNALARLLEHLKEDLSCHADVSKKGLPAWKRAELVLRMAERNVHAVDLHPFAAVLTTLNVLFLLMPLFVMARKKNPEFTLHLDIFSADSLEKGDEELLSPDMFEKINSRVQLTVDSYQRYHEMLKKRFDRVFGNPPWGGVLKGPAAPVYDSKKKKRFSAEFPMAAQGKYDVYGLFIERSNQLLNSGGRFGLITQGSFIDKEWAAGIRLMLATASTLRYIIDLNPFGQLFFNAMNTPCVTIADVGSKLPSGECIAVLSARAALEKETVDVRRKRVINVVGEVVKLLEAGQEVAQVDFASGTRITLDQLRRNAKTRWNLSGTKVATISADKWIRASDLLLSSQGVTPGGKGCLDIFLMKKERAKALGLEDELVYPVLKGRQATRWSVPSLPDVMLYPYRVIDQRALPAFTIDYENVDDLELRGILVSRLITDGLDYENAIDKYESGVISKSGINSESVMAILAHRAARKLLPFPKAAEFLTTNYEQLEGRIFKKKKIQKFNRQWYEYIWPRDIQAMLAKPKILSPRLTVKVRFALDVKGVLPQDSCICLVPRAKSDRNVSMLLTELSVALDRKATTADLLAYSMAFLNSEYAQQALVTGRRPTPKGSYAITDGYLKEIPIPIPQDGELVRKICGLVNSLVTSSAEKVKGLESELSGLVSAALYPESVAH